MRKKFNVFDYYLSLEKHNVLIYYKGPFIDVILAEISKDIREKFKSHPLTSQKIFSIFIELAQNVSHYSEERNVFGTKEKMPGNGTFVITETDDSFMLISGNLIKKDWAPEIKSKSEKINTLSKEELRKFKRELRNLPKKEGHHGANIGLIDMALKSENPLNVEINELDDDYAYFIISVAVSKNSKNINDQ